MQLNNLENDVPVGGDPTRVAKYRHPGATFLRCCGTCGFPRKFARYFDWRSDGTIIGTDRKRTASQITFLESGELESLFEDLSSTIGVSVDRFMVQAQKNVGMAIYANLPVRHVKRVPNNRFFRPQWMAKLLVRMMRVDIAGLGDGILGVDEYKAGKSLVIRFANPCVIPMLVGSSVGIYESLEDMPGAQVEYGLEEGDLVVRMTHAEYVEEEEARLYLEKVKPGTGPLEYQRCPSCGVPLLAAGTLQWDIKQGIISNRLTGEREVIVAVQSVNAIMRELENELGEEIPKLLYETQRKLTVKRLCGLEVEDAGKFWDNYLTNLGLRGLGYPLRFERGEDSVSVEIGNPYNQNLYAAKLAAALEVLAGKPSRIEWKRREIDHSEYAISAENDT